MATDRRRDRISLLLADAIAKVLSFRATELIAMTGTITGVSSMATRQLLADLSRSFEQTLRSGSVEIESMGGVDAARLVRDGKAIDVIVLASNVMEQLENEGWVVSGTRSGIASSGVAIAVRSGLPRPAIASEEDVKKPFSEPGRSATRAARPGII